MSRRSILSTVMLAAFIIVSPRAARAQNPTLSVSGGVSSYDLSGTGNTGFGAVGFEFPLASFLIIEPSMTVLSYSTQGRETRVHLFPEVQLQAQLPLGAVKPYLGAGLGASFASSEERSYNDVTLSGAGGVRIDFASGWGLGGELRIRAVDPWTGVTADFGFAVRRRL